MVGGPTPEATSGEQEQGGQETGGEVTGGEAGPAHGDGRVRRRQRNIAAALEATMDLFAATGAPPSPEEVAQRCGVSVSSIYRYFDTPAQMYELAAERRTEKLAHLAALERPGEGPLAERVERFVDNRLSLYAAAESVGRAWNRLGERNPAVLVRQRAALGLLRAQTEEHFAPELDRMDARQRRTAITTIDTVFQVASADHCTQVLGFDIAQLEAFLRDLLTTLLHDPVT